VKGMECAQMANTAASALVVVCCLVFAVVYHLHAPWRSTSVGRHLMTFTLALGALCAYTVLITVWPDGIVAAILRGVRTVMLLALASLVVQRTRMVLVAQHRATAVAPAEPDSRDSSH